MSTNVNDSLAFKKFTNNRYKIEMTDTESGILQMTPGLTFEELVGICVSLPGATPAMGVICLCGVCTSANIPEDHKGEVLIGMIGSGTSLYYSIKTGKATLSSAKIPDILAPTEG